MVCRMALWDCFGGTNFDPVPGLSQSPFLLISGSGSRPQLRPVLHATGTQIAHAKMPSLDAIFCRGNKSNPCFLARFHAAVNIKNLPLARRARGKFGLDLGASLPNSLHNLIIASPIVQFVTTPNHTHSEPQND